MKQIIRLSLPVSLTLLANMMMQVVDTAFVGRLSTLELGGVSLGNSIFGVTYGTSIGLLLGFDFLFSKTFGAQKLEDYPTYIRSGLILATLASLVTIFLVSISTGIYDEFGVSQDLTHQAKNYLLILAWSLLPFSLFMIFRQFLQSMGIVKPTFIILIAANVVNALMNYLFVWGGFGFPHWGVKGAAFSTLISRLFILISIIWVAKHEAQKRNITLFQKVSFNFKKEWNHLKLPLKLGIPSALQVLLEVGVFSTATLLAGKLGAESISAHHIVLQIASLTFMACLGVSSAAATLVGQSYGRNHYAQAKQTAWSALIYGCSLMGVFGLILYVFSKQILGLFTTHESIIRLAIPLVAVAAFFQIFDGAQTVLTGMLRGFGNTRSAAIANFIGHWLVGFPLAILFCFTFKLQITGIWIGLLFGLVAVSLILLWVWHQETKKYS